jgi:FixJ family two-component response regulator
VELSLGEIAEHWRWLALGSHNSYLQNTTTLPGRPRQGVGMGTGIIVTIKMPQMDGLELLSPMAEAQLQLPVIVLTARQ